MINQGKSIIILWYVFSIESSISVVPLALQNADCCKNVLVNILFGFLLWNGLTDSEENESSVLIMMFSPLSLLRMENRSSLKSAEKGCESSFCEGGTFHVWPMFDQILYRFDLVMMCQCCKMILRRKLFLLQLIELQFFLGARTAGHISSRKILSFRISILKFLKIGHMQLCCVEYWRKVCFFSETAKNWLMIVQKNWNDYSQQYYDRRSLMNIRLRLIRDM